MAKYKYTPLDTFVMRTPLFPMQYLDNLRSYADTPEFAEALLLGSFDLHDSVQGQDTEDEEEQEKEEKNESREQKEQKKAVSISKYLLRSCFRCTPFGAFAGCSTGTLGEKTDIELDDLDKYRKNTRLDMQFLCALIQKTEKDPEVRKNLRYHPNDSLYEIGGKLRYIEYKFHGKRTSHEVSSVETSPYLETILKAAEGDADIDTLARSIESDEITHEDAVEFINELIDNQILKSEVEPASVSDDVLKNFIGKLERLPQPPAQLPLFKELQALLEQIDSLPLGEATPLYEKVVEKARETGVEFDKKFLFQSDLFKPVKKAEVSPGVIEELNKTLTFLHGLATEQKRQNLESFKEAFMKRYESLEVPLTIALDSELGIGYPKSQGSNNILVDDLMVPGRSGVQQQAPSITMNNTDAVLLKKYVEAQKSDNIEEIVIEDKDFGTLRDTPSLDTIAVMCCLLSDDGENPRLWFKSAGGSSAANLLGRFCHTDASIGNLVKEIAQIERDAHPDKIIAEIAHLPESRTGNILSRPVFRDYVLHYLSGTDVDPDSRVGLDDLMVSVQRGRIMLRSKKYDKEVVPILTTAHNYSMSPIPAYKFLCDVQFQRPILGLGMYPGQVFDMFDHFPRIRYGNTILARQRWNVECEQFKKECEKLNDEELIEYFRKWRNEKGIPQCVSIAEGDNEMFIDFEYPECIRVFLALVRKRPRCKLEEYVHDTEGAVVRHNGNSYANEMIFIFRKQ